jgi:hypothetical protein
MCKLNLVGFDLSLAMTDYRQVLSHGALEIVLASQHEVQFSLPTMAD